MWLVCFLYARLAPGPLCFWSLASLATFVHGLLLCSSLIVVAPLCPLLAREEAVPFYPLPPLEEAISSKHHRACDPSGTLAAKMTEVVCILSVSNQYRSREEYTIIN